ncbi:MAG TPA: DNA repair protein RecO [Burkholderiales bacterium]|nr:DNA repair protein RecO [Burkholderiales bacterium]
MAERARQESREAFVLHSYPYRETSLLLEVFARGFGRVSMVARAARSPRSVLRGVLLAFQPLTLSWFGKGEVRTLARAEWVGGTRRLQGEALMCGFYLNELLLRLLPREDPHDALFTRYRDALQQLASRSDSAPVLRSFERALLKELGYAMALERDSASGGAIDPAKSYRYDPERGPIEANGAGPDSVVSGRTLLDMARDDYADPLTQQQAKALMRTLLDHRLEHQPLRSRRVFRDLLAL